MKILITGATGQLGKATIEFLRKAVTTTDIVAMTRSLEKAIAIKSQGIEVRTGDYSNIEAMNIALNGIDVLLLISTDATEDRFAQHRNAIDAAIQNNVKHIVYTSMLKASNSAAFEPAVDHYLTEQYMRMLDIPYTIFRNTFYAEIIPMLIGDSLKNGVWYYPAANAKANFVFRKDIAEALAIVLTAPAAHQNKIYEIASKSSYTFSEIAAMVTEATGTQLTYIAIPVDAMKEGMKQLAMPEALINLIASGAEAISKGEIDSTSNSLELLLGRKPLDLKDELPNLFI